MMDGKGRKIWLKGLMIGVAGSKGRKGVKRGEMIWIKGVKKGSLLGELSCVC